MLRNMVSGAAIVALWSATIAPAFAQDYRPVGFDAPRGATATLNLRVPLGAQVSRARPTFGLTVGYGRALDVRADGTPVVRQMTVADFRFSGSGSVNARVAGFDLAAPGRDQRLYLGGDSKKSLLAIGAIGAGALLACLIFGCFDDDGDGTVDTPTTPSNPG